MPTPQQSRATTAAAGLRRRDALAGASAWALASAASAHAPAPAPLWPEMRADDAQPQLALCRRVFEALARGGEPLPAQDLANVEALAAQGDLSTAALDGPSIQRSANLPDGAPAFDIRDATGRRLLRIECIWDGWYADDDMAARLLASTALMAAVLKKGDKLATEDLGPGVFNCVVVVPKP